MIDQIVALTQARRAGDGFLGKCPAHDDSKASLSFKDAGGKILLRCFTGCSFDAIREALKSRGITVAVLYIPYEPIQNPTTIYGNEDLSLIHI